MELRTYTKELPCTLTSRELQSYGLELAGIVQDIATEEARQLDIKAQLKARLLELQAKQTRVAGALNSKTEWRPTLVRVMATGNDATMAQEVRGNTGEVIATRPVTEEERQRSLAL